MFFNFWIQCAILERLVKKPNWKGKPAVNNYCVIFARTASIHLLTFVKNSNSDFYASFRYRSLSRTSFLCSKVTLSWVRKTACCRRRRRSWRRKSSAGRLGLRSAHRLGSSLGPDRNKTVAFIFNMLLQPSCFQCPSRIYWFSRKIQILTSTNGCILRKRLTWNASSSWLRKTLDSKLSSTSKRFLLFLE